MSSATSAAARVRPPTEDNGTELAVTAATASSATATGVGSDQGSDYWFSCVSASAFNIRFSDTTAGSSTITDPSSNYLFAAGTIYSFELNKRNTLFKVKCQSTGVFLYWRSSRT